MEVWENEGAKLYRADCRDVLPTLKENSIDSIITDPPYGLEFMGKDWDRGVPGIHFWQEALRVAKPGALLLAFGGTRTHHRLMCAIEDAGWELRDVIMWVYGCLSEDTEILTPDGWKTYETLFDGSMVMCYNVGKDSLEWQPVQEVVTYAYDDTAYHIQSDSTDQIVSRNHRCLVERGGRYVFRYAETLERQEAIPVLESVPDVQSAVPNIQQCASNTEQVLWHGMCSTGNRRGKQRSQDETLQGMASMPSVRQRVLATSVPYQQNRKADLQPSVQWCVKRQGMEAACAQGSICLDARERGCACGADDRRYQPVMEGRGNIFQNTWQLSGHQVREMPTGILADGSQGWLCDGAPTDCSPSFGPLPETLRSRASQRPRSDEQQSRQLDAVQQQHGPQAIRGTGATRPTLATVTPIHYCGVVWCVRVPTGAFVARRNGHVFVTGNSGFPKSHDISKAIDKAAGAERKVVGRYARPDGSAPRTALNKPTLNTATPRIAGTVQEQPITAPATPAARVEPGQIQV